MLNSEAELLSELDFGKVIAEDELTELKAYFIETLHWARIQKDEIDIVRGMKGSGKSALYVLMCDHEEELKKHKKTLVVRAENPSGTPVFRSIIHQDPPANERQFIALWKVYFSVLIAQRLRAHGQIGNDAADELFNTLRRADLLSGESWDLSETARHAVRFVKRQFSRIGLEASIAVDPSTGMPTPSVAVRVSPTEAEELTVDVDTDRLVRLADDALKGSGLKSWILFDRLDVAFSAEGIAALSEVDFQRKTLALRRTEINALRALLRTYLDLRACEAIRLKIFVRDDVWTDLTKNQRFSEASHIHRETTIEWDRASLAGLVAKRLIRNSSIRALLKIEEQNPKLTRSLEVRVLHRVFPILTHQGRVDPFGKFCSDLEDANGTITPRECINYLSLIRDEEIALLARADEHRPHVHSRDHLFSADAMRAALSKVSQKKLESGIYAEYPELKSKIELLRGCPRILTSSALHRVFELDNTKETAEVRDRLKDLGILKRYIPRPVEFEEQIPASHRDSNFWQVPLIYAEGLGMRVGFML